MSWFYAPLFDQVIPNLNIFSQLPTSTHQLYSSHIIHPAVQHQKHTKNKINFDSLHEFATTPSNHHQFAPHLTSPPTSGFSAMAKAPLRKASQRWGSRRFFLRTQRWHWTWLCWLRFGDRFCFFTRGALFVHDLLQWCMVSECKNAYNMSFTFTSKNQ